MPDYTSSSETHLRRGAYALAEDSARAALATGADEVDCRILWGRADLERGRLHSALEQFDKAAAAGPDRGEPHAWRVASLDRQWRDDEAMAVAEAGLARFPSCVELLIAAGRLHTKRFNPQEALRLYAEAAERAPDDPLAREWEVGGLRWTYRYGAAAAAIEAAISDCPGESRLVAERGHNLCHTGRHDEALAEYRAAFSADDQDRYSIDNLTEELCHLGRRDEAERYLRETCRQLPGEAWPFYSYAEHLFEEDRYLDSLAQYEEALRREPEFTAAITGAAAAERFLGRPDHAHDRLNAKLDDGTAQCPTRLNVARATSLVELERRDDALTLLQQLLSKNPHFLWAIELRTSCLNGLGRSSEARDVLRNCIARFPDADDLHVKLAWQLQRCGERAAALREFELAATADPHNEDAWSGKIRMLAETTRTDEAIEAAETGMRRWPLSVSPMMELVYIHVENGRPERALELVERTIAQQPWAWNALAWRVHILQRLSRWGAAETAAAEAMSKNPDLNSALDRYLNVIERRGRAREVTLILRRELDRRPGDIWLLLRLEQRLRGWHRHGDALAVLDDVAHRYDGPSLYTRRAVSLIATRQFDECESLLAAAIDRFGRLPELLIMRADLYESTGQLEIAISLYSEILDTDPDRVEVSAWQIYDLSDLHRFDEAEALARAQCVRRPYVAAYHGQLGGAHRARGQYEAAVQEFRSAQELSPDNIWLVIHEVAVLQEQHHLDEAESRARAARTRWPDSLYLQLELGRVLDRQSRFPAALVEFDSILQAEPMLASAAIAKSASLRSMRRFAEAEVLIRRIAADQPNDQGIIAELGWIQRDRQQPAAATVTFQGLLHDAVNPFERRDARCGLGWIALDQSQLGIAESHFRSVLKELPHSIQAQLGVAWVLVRRNDRRGDDEAERMCLDVMAQRPLDHDAHTCLGVLNFRRGQLSAAGYHLRRAVEIDPYQGSHVDLGAFLAKLDRLEEAENALRHAIELDPDDPQAHIEMGNVFLQRASAAGDGGAPHATQAVYHFRQARLTQPESGTAALGLALACAGGGPGGLVTAEQTLRHVLTLPQCDLPAAQLRLALARVMVQQGDLTQRSELYEEALEMAVATINEAPTDAAGHYVAGLAEFKMAENEASIHLRPWRRHRARRFLRRCVELDKSHVEAGRTLRALDRASRLTRPVTVGSTVLAALAAAVVVTMWVGLAGVGPKVDATVVAALTPIMIGLVALSIVLPSIVRLRLPGGIEADLYASLSQVSAGPTGTESAGPARLSLGLSRAGVSDGPVARHSRHQ